MTIDKKTLRARSRRQLAKSFAKVPLGFKLLGGPLAPSNADIFQMDIHASRRFGEYVRIWPGASDNEIEVLAFDKGLRQLVLRVSEPRRSFTQWVPKRWTSQAEAVEQAEATGGQLLGDNGMSWHLELWTPTEERRFLCGRDDVHLFIAQVSGGGTVARAHEALTPLAVRQARRRRPNSVRRQGEWFFVPLTARDIRTLDEQLATRPRAIRRRHPVGAGGRPHRADEVVRVDRRVRADWRRLSGVMAFARGWVRHPDHNPLYLEHWRRVVRNLEVGAAEQDRLRLQWID